MERIIRSVAKFQKMNPTRGLKVRKDYRVKHIMRRDSNMGETLNDQ